MTEKTAWVILVNAADEEIGREEKMLAHQYAMLHRAFSVFIFRERQGKKELLLQQRNLNKYHAVGLWTNTCCSHPKPEEHCVQTSAENRLKEEMGLTVSLEKKGVFHYVAAFENGLYENEIDHVFVGTYDKEAVPFNKDEVADCCWMEVSEVQEALRAYPEKYTPWFAEALEIALRGS